MHSDSAAASSTISDDNTKRLKLLELLQSDDAEYNEDKAFDLYRELNWPQIIRAKSQWARQKIITLRRRKISYRAYLKDLVVPNRITT